MPDPIKPKPEVTLSGVDTEYDPTTGVLTVSFRVDIAVLGYQPASAGMGIQLLPEANATPDMPE